MKVMGSSFPNQGLNPGPKHQVLTTGPLGKSPRIQKLNTILGGGAKLWEIKHFHVLTVGMQHDTSPVEKNLTVPNRTMDLPVLSNSLVGIFPEDNQVQKIINSIPVCVRGKKGK